MVKVGDSMIVTGEFGHCIPVGSKVIVLEVGNNSLDRTCKVETESGFRQWVSYDDLHHIAPPQKITQNGYEYSLVGSVKPEWLVDGAWVVGKIYGVLYQVIEGENNNFSFRDNHSRLEAKKISTIVNYYRPHEPKDWKWGDWAMYAGRKVFVIEKGNWMGDIRVSHPDLLDGVTCVSVLSLTPTF